MTPRMWTCRGVAATSSPRAARSARKSSPRPVRRRATSTRRPAAYRAAPRASGSTTWTASSWDRTAVTSCSTRSRWMRTRTAAGRSASTAFLVMPSASSAWPASTTATRRSSSRRPRTRPCAFSTRPRAGARAKSPTRTRGRRTRSRAAVIRERRLRVGGRRRRRRALGPALAARRGALLGARVPARPDHDRVLAVHALPGDGLRGQGGLRLRRAPRGRRGRGLEVPGRSRDRRVRRLFAAAPAARDGWF